MEIYNHKTNDCGTKTYVLVGRNGGESNVFTHLNGGARSGNGLNMDIESRIYIDGCIIYNPREITRQISFNCRTQKVESEATFQLQGQYDFSVEKMREIEDILHSKELFLNGEKVQFNGGTAFEPMGENMPNRFRLNVTLSFCTKRQIFGCVPKSAGVTIVIPPYNGDPIKEIGLASTITYAIPEIAQTQTYYNEQGTRIANTYTELLDYYNAKEDVEVVQDVAIATISTDVRFRNVFTVGFNKQRPENFYYDKVSPSNKVYGMTLSEPNAYNELSRGVNSIPCSPIFDFTITQIDETCSNIDFVLIEAYNEPCLLELSGNIFAINGENNEVFFEGTNKKLSLNVFSSYLFMPSINEVYVSDMNWMMHEVPFANPIPSNAQIVNVTLNDISILGDYTFNIEDNHLFILEGLEIVGDDVLVLTYKEPIQDLLIAQISGDCNSNINQTLYNDDDNQIPIGSNLRIDENGFIWWNGAPIYSSGGNGYITLNNINIL